SWPAWRTRWRSARLHWGCIARNSTSTCPPDRRKKKNEGTRLNIRASSPHQASRQSFRTLGRALGYIGHYPRAAIIAYGTLLIASLAQLAVPWLVRQIIDAITDGTLANAIIGLPPAVQEQAVTMQGTTLAEIQQTAAGAEDALIAVCVAIVVFALARGVFAFLQGYMAEWLSQSIAFDFRNELFAKIQRLSFSYHDR